MLLRVVVFASISLIQVVSGLFFRGNPVTPRGNVGWRIASWVGSQGSPACEVRSTERHAIAGGVVDDGAASVCFAQHIIQSWGKRFQAAQSIHAVVITPHVAHNERRARCFPDLLLDT